MPKIQISKYGTQSVNVADIFSDDDAVHQIEEIAKARLAEQSEITALREKLAAAEASLAERGRMLELTHRVQRSYRTAVAAALAELRAHWNVQYQDYVSKTDDSSWERRQELLDRMRELDATIAKLGSAICYEDRLPETLTDEQYNQWHASSWVQDAVRVGVSIEAVPASCTWTPDDDGNYATGCDGLFVIIEGTPAENKMAYCCYCGKPIKEQPK